MEVTSKNNHITHAVIGQHKAQNMGISDSPEFFQILSSSLYTDQILAVVREVMCNAWDAHIEAGIADKPLSVTLSATEFTVRDFGTGIAKDMMQPIYGVYGQSTKKLKNNLTGGFGLGCKAPFAYTEHFEVTSWNQEEKTVYSVSKSSAKALGKPAITPIVTLPTKETGLQVSIKIKISDKSEFMKDLVKVVSNGEMLVSLNSEIMPNVKFSQSENGYTILTDQSHTGQAIFVRYGHVIYPLPRRDEYFEEFDKATNTIQKLESSSSYHQSHLILQAAPNTVAITPSREQLSFQIDTVKTVKELLTKFNQQTKQLTTNNLGKFASNYLKKANTTDVFNFTQLNCKFLNQIKDLPIITTKCQIEETFLKKHSNLLHNKKEFVVERLKAISKKHPEKKENIYAAIKEINKSDKVTQPYTEWIAKFYAKPVVKELLKIGINKNLDSNFYFTSLILSNAYSSERPIIRYCNTASYILMSDSINVNLILTFEKSLPLSRIAKFKNINQFNQEKSFCLVYRVTKKDKNLEKIRDTLSKLKQFNFVDLTKIHPWESQEVLEPTEKRMRRKVQKGFLTLKSVLSDKVTVYKDINKTHEDPLSIKLTEPNAVFLLKSGSEIFDAFSFKDMCLVSKHFGGVIGVVDDKLKYTKAIKNKIPDINEYLVKEILSFIQQSVNLQNYFILNNTLQSSTKKSGTSIETRLLSLITQSAAIQDHLQLTNLLTEKEEEILEIYKLLKNILYKKQFIFTYHNEYINSLGVNQKAENIVNKASTRIFVKYLDIHLLVQEFKYSKTFASLSPELKKVLLIIF